MKGLIIEGRQIEDILTGTLRSLIRPDTTSELNRTVALIQSESGVVIGSCKITSVHSVLTAEDLAGPARGVLLSSARAQEDSSAQLRYYAWRMGEAARLTAPIEHHRAQPRGQITWVDLPPAISQRIKAELALAQING
jgi:hypothetical protein